MKLDEIDLAHTASFTLGLLTVNPALRTVALRNAESESLEPRVMQVLVALAQAGGGILSRDDLISRCWQGRIVGEDAINRVISRLRHLGRGIGAGSIDLETVPRVGYRLKGLGSGDTRPPDDILIAVLPFDNLSDDPELRWFSDGLSEEILQTIARGTSIRVVGRSSSFQFRGDQKLISTIARELGATHILDGTARRGEDGVRVSAHLIETATQTTLWSDRFDLASEKVFVLQDRIAEQVASALDRTFAASRRSESVDPVGYDLYLRGAELARDIVPDSQRQAIVLLGEATRRLPEFADAWGNLALARAQGCFLQFDRSTSGNDDRAKIEMEGARALSLDSECRSARLAPYVGAPIFDFAIHRHHFESPLPSALGRTASPDVSPGVQLLEVGHGEEALEFFRQAERFDPLFQIQIFYHSFALAAAGQGQAGLDKLDGAVERWPHIPFFAAARIRWAAAANDWASVEALTDPARLARYSLLYRTEDVTRWIEACRGCSASSQSLERLRDSAFGIGNSGLEELLLHARFAGLATTLEMLDQASEKVVRFEAPRRPDDLGAISLFLPIYSEVRRDPSFGTLCDRLGLSEFWRRTARWPPGAG